MNRVTLGIAMLVVGMLAMYGWVRICDDYVDPFIKRVVHRIVRRARTGKDT